MLNSIEYRGYLFTFCMAGVFQVARLIQGLKYGTRESDYKCKGKYTIGST
jgi:hypothetical protein